MAHDHEGLVARILADHFAEIREGSAGTKRIVKNNFSFEADFVAHQRRGLRGPLQRTGNHHIDLDIQRAQSPSDLAALLHAGIIDYLTRAKARVIAYDVLFLEGDTRASFPVGDRTMSGAESDAELAASIKRAGNVVMLADATYEGLQSGADAATLVPPSLPGRT